MSRPPSRQAPSGPAGFTLVELLVAATLALVVMAALASLFGIFGRAVADSQELVQLAARMRSAAWRLRQDLQGATSEAKPFVRPEQAGGYFEIVEGPIYETGATMVADVDDVVMLTTASPGRPFTGLLSGSVSLESPVAEVAWFCKQASQPTADGLQLYNLYRRQLLVSAAPGAGGMQTTNSVAFTTWDAFYLNNDLSVRREGSLLIANSLADLVRRQSRFLHWPSGVIGTTGPKADQTWPAITTAAPVLTSGSCEVLTSVREGEDLLLSNVIAFDVRVFDPQRLASSEAYVNLGELKTTALSGVGTGGTPALASMPAKGCVYDTSSAHVEFNNFIDNSRPTSTIDRNTNLVDEAAYGSSTLNGVVDDVTEFELPPPYNVPLRGVEIRIRCYEPSSQEVRQITVQHSFLAR